MIMEESISILNFFKYFHPNLWLPPAGSHLFEGPIFPFRYTILLGCVGNGVLDIDPIFSTYLNKI